MDIYTLPPAITIPTLTLMLCSLPVPDTASALDGWQLFRSSEGNRSDVPAFTLRYPPGFERHDPKAMPDTELPGITDKESWTRLGTENRTEKGTESRTENKSIQAFGMSDSTNGRIYFLIVSADRIPSDQKTLMEEMGREEYWTALGNSAGEELMGRFDNARVFERDGMRIAEMFFTKEPVLGKSNPYVTFSIQHTVEKGDYLFALDCFLDVPLQVSIQGGFTSGDNPAVDKYCTPFFQSLEFQE